MRVVVTGGSKGLGLGICADLLAAGHQVDAIARKRTDEVEALEADHTETFRFVEGDLTDAEAVDAFLSEAREAQGLVNNAGMAVEGLLATQAVEQIDRVLDLNVRASLVATKRFVRSRLAAREPGSIVNISSIVGIRGYAGLTAYAATKAAILGATRALARELGAKAIRVNAVLPGYLDTDLSRSLTRDQLEQIERRTPLGRLGTTEDVAPLVRFLLGDEARFITGQEFVVDGGITV